MNFRKKRSIQEQKVQLRHKMRSVINLPHKIEEEKKILHHLVSFPFWQEVRTILLYHPLSKEPNLLALLDKLSHRFFFPRIHNDELELYEWFPEAPWIKGPHGVQEPDLTTWQRGCLSKIDLALVPGMAFDPQGNRLGHGAGYFDRLLGNPSCHALKVGIAWSWQLVPKIPSEPHDVRMDFVVTPESCF